MKNLLLFLTSLLFLNLTYSQYPIVEEFNSFGGTGEWTVDNGGWDENYPLGLTADWGFFFKCQMVGLKMVRTYNTHFYHFGSLTTRKNPEESNKRDQLQMQASEYAKYKWGSYIYNENNTNTKYLK